jgi:hypothetical protein
MSIHCIHESVECELVTACLQGCRCNACVAAAVEIQAEIDNKRREALKGVVDTWVQGTSGSPEEFLAELYKAAGL